MGKVIKRVLLTFILSTIILLESICIIFAKDIYIVYNNPNGFNSQAEYMAEKYSDEYTIKYVRSSEDFKRYWNIVANGCIEYEHMIIMLHGGVKNDIGGLYFYKESLWNSYDELSYLGGNLTGNILLLSCDGGTGGTNSVAYNLSKRSGSAVITAKDSGVNYNRFLNKNPTLADMLNVIGFVFLLLEDVRTNV